MSPGRPGVRADEEGAVADTAPAGPDGGAAGGLAVQRHQLILQRLRARGQVNATLLAETLGVTHETIRKDLVLLQEHGLLRRVHGGAVPVESLVFEPPVGARTAYGPEKARIAAAARELVPSSGAVLIDSGSTTAALAEAFPAGADVVAITNSLPIALTLLPQLERVSLLGGRVRPETQATVDQWALQSLASVRADVAFLGTNAFSLEHGLATPNEGEAALKGALVRASRLRVLLADHSKYGRESVYRYAMLSEIDVLVTDDGFPEDEVDALVAASGVEIVRA